MYVIMKYNVKKAKKKTGRVSVRVVVLSHLLNGDKQYGKGGGGGKGQKRGKRVNVY